MKLSYITIPRKNIINQTAIACDIVDPLKKKVTVNFKIDDSLARFILKNCDTVNNTANLNVHIIDITTCRPSSSDFHGTLERESMVEWLLSIDFMKSVFLKSWDQSGKRNNLVVVRTKSRNQILVGFSASASPILKVQQISKTPADTPTINKKNILTIFLNKKDILEPVNIHNATYSKSTFNGLIKIRLNTLNLKALAKKLNVCPTSTVAAHVKVKIREALTTAQLRINSANEGILTCQFPRETARLFLMQVDSGKIGLKLSGIQIFTLTTYHLETTKVMISSGNNDTESSSSTGKTVSAKWKGNRPTAYYAYKPKNHDGSKLSLDRHPW